MSEVEVVDGAFCSERLEMLKEIDPEEFAELVLLYRETVAALEVPWEGLGEVGRSMRRALDRDLRETLA